MPELTPDPDAVLDALADGLTIGKVAQRYGTTQVEVRRLLKEATTKAIDGEEVRQLALGGPSSVRPRDKVLAPRHE